MIFKLILLFSMQEFYFEGVRIRIGIYNMFDFRNCSYGIDSVSMNIISIIKLKTST